MVWMKARKKKLYPLSTWDQKPGSLFLTHTRSDESCFNKLSYQQGSTTPQWFLVTWKAECRWEWTRSSYHTRIPCLPFSEYSNQQQPVSSSPSTAEEYVLCLIGVSAPTPYTISGYAATVIKVPFSALHTPWPFPMQTLIVSVKPKAPPPGCERTFLCWWIRKKFMEI